MQQMSVLPAVLGDWYWMTLVVAAVEIVLNVVAEAPQPCTKVQPAPPAMRGTSSKPTRA
jgi:hypothetical protein